MHFIMHNQKHAKQLGEDHAGGWYQCLFGKVRNMYTSLGGRFTMAPGFTGCRTYHLPLLRLDSCPLGNIRLSPTTCVHVCACVCMCVCSQHKGVLVYDFYFAS